MKESKLGLLAESKLTPSTGATQVKPANGDAGGEAVKPPPTFSFTPLTKPVEETKPGEGETNNTNTATKQDKEEEDKKEQGFVFGQNLTDRVENTNEEGADSTTPDKVFGEDLGGRMSASEDSTSDGTTTTTKSPQSLFGGMVSPPGAGKIFKNNIDVTELVAEDGGSTKTLSESAAEYTESHSNKRKYDVVDVVTGEEEESNVLQANVKMYLFDTEKRNWTERGRGVLRLNDDPVSTPGHLKSRLVMRTVGSLRVVLNTKLWPNMICEKVESPTRLHCDIT